ncbi:hypothetical protein HMN09_01003400 [Mycena chlorophos]|uniref:F-box domain-containing protein n=1 Tax=Mycena chlorophos TaxID=658473 RepID=A0A8H6SJI6_MYCCL|nr:hypothetical protein HMN09_01003400 [Mycena chlorophos]
MDALPVELLALIVSFASGPDLKALCLVSSRFTEHCQRRLHASIALDPDNSTRTFRLFSQYPHLGGYVQSCTLLLYGVGTHDHWDPLVFLATLRRLTNVRRVAVQNAEWSRLAEPMRAALLELLERVLRHGELALEVIEGLPIDVFDYIARRATHLVLREVSIIEGNSEPSASAAPDEMRAAPLLKMLVLPIRRFGIDVPASRLAPYLGSLETLEVVVRGEDRLHNLADVVHCASSTIRQLTVKVPVYVVRANEFGSHTILGPISLPSVETIRYGFVLQDRRSNSSRLSSVYVHQLQVILRTLPSFSTPRLRLIHIQFDMDVAAETPQNPVEYVLSPNLAELDNTLASRIQAGSGRVEVVIGYHQELREAPLAWYKVFLSESGESAADDTQIPESATLITTPLRVLFIAFTDDPICLPELGYETHAACVQPAPQSNLTTKAVGGDHWALLRVENAGEVNEVLVEWLEGLGV